jgi:hypothetical protein
VAGITEEEIIAVVNNPSEETASVKGRINLWGQAGPNRLKVTIKKDDGDVVVVTAIRRGLR